MLWCINNIGGDFLLDFIIKYWLQILFSGVLSALTFVIKKMSEDFKKEKLDQKSIRLGVQAILRDRLIQSYNHHMGLGYCPIHDRDNISNMYNQYHNLGENGVMDGLVDEIMKIKKKKPV